MDQDTTAPMHTMATRQNVMATRTKSHGEENEKSCTVRFRGSRMSGCWPFGGPRVPEIGMA
jgi:hypothetical protein